MLLYPYGASMASDEALQSRTGASCHLQPPNAGERFSDDLDYFCEVHMHEERFRSAL